VPAQGMNLTRKGLKMSREVFYAHSLPGRPESEWQPLEDHLEGTARLDERFASAFGLARCGWRGSGMVWG
jgi:hypothetical protein